MTIFMKKSLTTSAGIASAFGEVTLTARDVTVRRLVWHQGVPRTHAHTTGIGDERALYLAAFQ